jgi:putative DNA primase/helicase
MITAIDQFKNAMLEAGITPPDTIIGDGNLHRFKIEGKLNGAYVLHLDGRAAGYFQDFKQGIKRRWKIAEKYKPLTDAERQSIRDQHIRQESERKAEEDAKHKLAARKSALIWQNALPAPFIHPYLIRKNIYAHGIRRYKNSLVIPLHNALGELVNLQFIHTDGTKRFLSGGKKAGCFYPIGNLNTADIILIGEGFATCVSLYKHTGYGSVVAFDAGNLKAVALIMRRLYPHKMIIIAGDNDESGTGQKAARDAALATDSKFIIPEIAGHDWNDVLNMEVSNGR